MQDLAELDIRPQNLIDTVKRVKLSSVRSCAPRASRGPLPIFSERRGTTVETTLISDDVVTFLADRCQSRRHLPAKRTVTCVSLLSLRRPCHTWPARSPHLASVPQASWTQLSSQRCNPKFFASATDVQVISNDACAELKSCSWDKIVLSSCAYAGQSGSLLIHLVYVVSPLYHDGIES